MEMEAPVEPPISSVVAESYYPLYQDLDLYKVEWLIIGGIIFLAVLAWTDLIFQTLRRYMFGENINIFLYIVYAVIITAVTILLIRLLKKSIDYREKGTMPNIPGKKIQKAF